MFKTKYIIGVGILAIAGYLIWKESKKTNIVGTANVNYEFKNFSTVEPEVIVQDGLMPQFGRPLIIKNR